MRVSLLAVFLLSGCAQMHLYEGPHRSEKELAYFSANPDEVAVISIDGEEYAKRFLIFEGYVLPGERKVTARLNWTSYYGGGGAVVSHTQNSPLVKTFCFNAEPGKRYSAGSFPGGVDWSLIVREEISFFVHEEIEVYQCEL